MYIFKIHYNYLLCPWHNDLYIDHVIINLLVYLFVELPKFLFNFVAPINRMTDHRMTITKPSPAYAADTQCFILPSIKQEGRTICQAISARQIYLLVPPFKKSV